MFNVSQRLQEIDLEGLQLLKSNCLATRLVPLDTGWIIIFCAFTARKFPPIVVNH